jgi:hypothetical protein
MEASVAAGEETPKPKTTDTSPDCDETPPSERLSPLLAELVVTSIAETIYDSFQRWRSNGSTFTTPHSYPFPFLTVRNGRKNPTADDDDAASEHDFSFPSFLISHSFQRGLPAQKKEARGLFHFAFIHFTPSVQRTGFACLIYLQERKITRQQYTCTLLARHTRGFGFRERERERTDRLFA